MSNSSTSYAALDYLSVNEHETTAIQSRDNDYFAGPISHQLAKRPHYENKDNSPSAPRRQLTSILNEVRRFAESLEPFTLVTYGWNGPDSHPPEKEAIMMALETCFVLVNQGLPRPNPKMLSNGGLGGFWCIGRDYATMDFESDGEHIWTVTDGTNYKSGTWKLGENIPALVDSITKIPR